MHAQRAPDQRSSDRKRAEHEQRAQAQAAYRRARVLPRLTIFVPDHRAHTYAFIGVCGPRA